MTHGKYHFSALLWNDQRQNISHKKQIELGTLKIQISYFFRQEGVSHKFHSTFFWQNGWVPPLTEKNPVSSILRAPSSGPKQMWVLMSDWDKVIVMPW